MQQMMQTGYLAAAAAVVSLAALGGCQSTQYASPLVTEYDRADAGGELDFWHGLAEQPVTTHNDAFHGLIELAHGSDPTLTYEQRIAWLCERGYLDWGYYRPHDQAVTRGTVAQVICRILRIEGGLTMRLIGAHPRYATRELVYREIMAPGTAQQAMSGIAFVGVIGKARDHAQEKDL
ncbi:MAG: hypothetical protein KGY81_07275 [Phycisphaerae bacterium]|jgi:hypothetical protein|nr:hypothetical protein [Phycisphaerae bacterium]